MATTTFGADGASWGLGSTGIPAKLTLFTLWTAQTGGSLVTTAGTAGSVTTDANGVFPLFTDTAGHLELWADGGAGRYKLYCDLTSLISGGTGGSGFLFVDTAQTANFTASANLGYHIDLTSGSVQLTLPSDPADGTQVYGEISAFGAGHTFTVIHGSGDTIENAGTPSRSLGVGQSIWMQFDQSTRIWTELPDRTPLSLVWAAAATLTNKRVTKRVLSPAFNAHPTYDTDNCDVLYLAITGNITDMSVNATGTPVDQDPLLVKILDDGTSRTLNWGANFAGSNVPLPTATQPNVELYCMFIWSAPDANWVLLSSSAPTTAISGVRITRRELHLSANSATPTIDTDNYDTVRITGQSANITSFTTNLTGTAQNPDTLWVSIEASGSITVAWGASFESSTISLPTAVGSGARIDLGLKWNPTTSKWRCVGVA